MTRRREASFRRRSGVARRLAWALPLALGVMLGACAGAGTQVASEGASPEVRPAEPARVKVQQMEISAAGQGTRIRFQATGEPRNRLDVDPKANRAELTLFDVTFEGLPPRTEVGDGLVDAVDLRALPAGSGLVTVQLARPAEVAVQPWSGGLDLVVEPAAAQAPAPMAAASSGAAAPVRVEESASGVRMVLNAEPSNLGAFVLSDGRRLVVDADGVTLPDPQVVREFASGPIARVRLGRQGDRVRAVVEAREEGAFQNYRVEKRADGFEVVLSTTASPGEEAPPVAAMAAAASSPASFSPPPTGVQGANLAGGGRVVDLGFHQEPDRSLVDIGLSKPAPHEVREATGERVVLDLLHTALPEAYRRALDTSAFPGPVRLVAAYPRGEDTRVVVDLRSATPFRLEGEGDRLTLAFEGGSSAPRPAGVAQVKERGDEVVVVEGAPGATGPAATPETPSAGPAKGATAEAPAKVYTGKRLSLDFVDADIRNVLRLIGEVSGLNVVAGDDVQGKVTVRLVDVPWDQALEVLLKTRGLDQVREGNVIRIAPAERLAQEKARALEAAKAAEQKEPLITDILPVNYASADEISDKVKSILTERGTVTVDARTNALLVKDVAENVAAARALVRRLDTQTPQVLIEARIVEVSSTFAKDLGVQWGGRFTADTAHGNATDWAFPNSIGVSGSTGADNFAVNLPAAVSAGSPGGALALSLGHINDVLSLDLRLSAIETSGRGRVVSSPRVTTLDNKTAEISQGTEIPFTTATEEKIETQSIDYKLKLNVTPHVTSDKSIIMKIDVTKDAPSTTYFAVDSRTPAKETRAATTEVLVKDGETTVIGGIITDTQSKSESAIPWLGKIPVIGWLFKKKDDRVDKTELIIFITPKIVNAEPVARSL